MYMSHKSKKTDTYVDQIEITSLRVVSTTFFFSRANCCLSTFPRKQLHEAVCGGIAPVFRGRHFFRLQTEWSSVVQCRERGELVRGYQDEKGGPKFLF